MHGMMLGGRGCGGGGWFGRVLFFVLVVTVTIIYCTCRMIHAVMTAPFSSGAHGHLRNR